MTKYKRTARQRADRLKARHAIVDAANADADFATKPYSMRRIQQAVNKVRQSRSVDALTLLIAGFNER